jgi:hypothetical protein
MSFTGDLEHLSIVDVIQLLHATRKSGTLVVQGRKGESQLVFQEGYIVSANHVDNSIRIGNILVDHGVLSDDQLHLALLDQNIAGPNRKPLIAMLIEQGQVKPDEAYRCLQSLIELTIVEIIGWRRGTFTLDVENQAISDEYRYFPEKLNKEIFLHTENVLMDAVRIYDERVRDGMIADELDADEGAAPAGDPLPGMPSVISADDLGLGDMDVVAQNVTQFFTILEDHSPIPRRVPVVADNMPPEMQEAMLNFVDAYPPAAPLASSCVPVSVIFVSPDEFFAHCLTVVCKQEGIFVFTTNEVADIGPIVQQSLARKSLPVLVFDVPFAADCRFSGEAITQLRQQKRNQFPHLCLLQLVPPCDVGFALQALRDGVRAVLPRPRLEEWGDAFFDDVRRFLQAFPAYVKSYGCDQTSYVTRSFRGSSLSLRSMKEPAEVAATILHFASGLFNRTLTLIVRGQELIAERSLGISLPREEGMSPPLGFKIPLADQSLFQTVVEKGLLFFGDTDDAVMRLSLFSAIGEPANHTVMLLPLKVNGKVISLVYGDFGPRETAAVQIELLEVLASEAGLVLENAFYRKKLERS